MNDAELKRFDCHCCARCGGPVPIGTKYCLSCESMNMWDKMQLKKSRKR